MLDLTLFTNPSDLREFARQEINIGGFVGACDGRVIIVDLSRKVSDTDNLIDFHADLKTRNPHYKTEEHLRQLNLQQEQLDWQTLPAINPDKYKECNNCESDGKIASRKHGCEECNDRGEVEFSNDHNLYTIPCKSCGGDGNDFTGRYELCPTCHGTKKHLSFVPHVLGNDDYAMSGEYAELLLKLPDIEYLWIEEYQFFFFRFSHGYGIVNPMKR